VLCVCFFGLATLWLVRRHDPVFAALFFAIATLTLLPLLADVATRSR
jgi:hypothetical protein